MASLSDEGVRKLLETPNHAIIATHNDDGTIHSAVVWIDGDDSTVAVNSAVGRKWPTNVDKNPNVTVTVLNQENPFEYFTVTGTAEGSTDGADEHINALSKKYIGQDEYPFRQPGEQRIMYRITPSKVRYVKQ